MTPIILEWISWGSIMLGTFFLLTGAVGLLRMPDFYTRLHPCSVVDGIGMPLFILGIILQFPLGIITVKLLFLMVFSWITSATASHALGKAALLSGLKPQGTTSSKPRSS